MGAMGFDTVLIAPCGMNCGICAAHLREKRQCPGCNGPDAHKPARCVNCSIRHCEGLRSSGAPWCGLCGTFPCDQVRRLDARYRKKYGMSMIENLGRITRDGPESFMAGEAARWRCGLCGETVCVHDGRCSPCGAPRETPADTGRE
jgi:hypothetical protein